MITSSAKISTVALALASSFSPSLFAELPLDVSELTLTEVRMWNQLAVGSIHSSDVDITRARTHHVLRGEDVLDGTDTARVNARYNDYIWAELFLGVLEHKVNADGLSYILESELEFYDWEWDLFELRGHSTHLTRSFYNLTTTGDQVITLTMEITGVNWPVYSLGRFQGDRFEPSTDEVSLDDMGLSVRSPGESDWTDVPLEVVLPEASSAGSLVSSALKVRSLIELPAGEYELKIVSRSSRFSEDKTSESREFTRVTLGFEAVDAIPVGLSMFSQGHSIVRAEIRDDAAGVLYDWSSSVARGVPAIAEEVPTNSYAMGVFDYYVRTAGDYRYTFFSEGAVGTLFDPSMDGDLERTLEVNGESSFQFTADETMRLHMSFPSWLESEWDERTFSVEVIELDTGEVVEPLVVRDHGRQLTYQIAPGSYEFTHILSMHRRVEGSDQPMALTWKDDIDASVVFRLLGDTNGDGRVDGQDLSLLLGNWGKEDPTMSLDAHDVIDGRDLSVLLGSWSS